MSEYTRGSVDDSCRRLGTGFGGGLGGKHQELCGALSGGVMVIGALYGRTDAGQDKTRCYGLVNDYRERFAETFGATICQHLRDGGWGTDDRPCAGLVEQAARILVEILK